MPCNVIVLIPTMFMNIIGTLAENDTVAVSTEPVFFTSGVTLFSV